MSNFVVDSQTITALQTVTRKYLNEREGNVIEFLDLLLPVFELYDPDLADQLAEIADWHPASFKKAKDFEDDCTPAQPRKLFKLPEFVNAIEIEVDEAIAS